jgi:MFS superfamily sulfate permease-like transporter
MITALNKKEKPGFFAHYLPIVAWLPKYDRSWLSGDIIAGLSVWALTVPQALGYAIISGVPVQYGLYAALIACFVNPLFTTSRHVVTGPSSTIAAVTGAAVLSIAAAGSEEAVLVAALITVIAGLIYIVLAVLKMGWISKFLSTSVLTGFIFGIGINVVVGQLDYLTGSPQAEGNTWQQFFSWLTNLSESNLATVIVGVAALLFLVLLKLFAPKVPGALIAVLLGIGAAVALDLASLGVVLVGEVPAGLPSLTMPTWSLLTEYGSVIITGAIGVVLVGFSESLAAAKEYAAKHHYDIDSNQEMLAQGMANTASGLFQGINVSGSLSKSSLNDSSGAKTELASIAQGFLCC